MLTSIIPRNNNVFFIVFSFNCNSKPITNGKVNEKEINTSLLPRFFSRLVAESTKNGKVTVMDRYFSLVESLVSLFAFPLSHPAVKDLPSSHPLIEGLHGVIVRGVRFGT